MKKRRRWEIGRELIGRSTTHKFGIKRKRENAGIFRRLIKKGGVKKASSKGGR